MSKSTRFLLACLLAGAAVLLFADESQAQLLFRRRGWVRPPVYPPNRMPGWDWWRTYPWSPYNYGRNPYNPAFVPYPVYETPILQASSSQPATVPTTNEFLPEPTGAITQAPPTVAVIRLEVPDPFAEVWFDDVKTSSVGRVRFYVTPDLPSPNPYKYNLKIRLTNGASPGTEDRTITVQRGEVTRLQFGQK
jgi:uncharacterized protein (TIGR03000 family)